MTVLTANEHLTPNPDWSADIRRDLLDNAENGRVGHTLLSETDDVRIWRIHLKPGERVGFHRHQLNYFWVAINAGSSLSHYATGEQRETTYAPGDVCHFTFREGQFMLHDLINTGSTDLLFTTVEFKRSPNPPLSI